MTQADADLQPDQEPPRDRRPIFALLAANAVSQVGNMMTAVALPWFVLETTGSAAQTGIAAAALTGGAVLSAGLGGPLVDRLGFKRASVLGDVVSSLTILSVPLLHLAGILAFWQLVVLVFILAVVNAQGDTAKFALVPILSTRGAIALERANSADRAIARIGQVVGPVLAGIFIALFGAANVLFVQAATFAVAAVLIVVGVPALARPVGLDGGTERPSYLSELSQGLRFVGGNRLILSMVLMATMGNLIDIPLVQVVIPIYVREIFGNPAGLGAILGALGGGALLGTVLFGLFGRRLPRRVTFLACWFFGPLLLYGTLALTPPLVVLVVVGLAAGLLAGPINPLLLTVIQENVPQELAGRVFGALGALAQAGVPLGAAAAGFIVQGFGIVPTILAMLGAYVAVVTTMVFNPALRRMDSQRRG